MAIVKIVIVAVIVATISLYLKKYTPETAILASIAGGLIIISLIVEHIFGVTEILGEMFTGANIEPEIIKIIVKVTFLAYLVEFAAGAVKDLGENSLSEKVLLAGKIAVLSLSLPIIRSLLELVRGLLVG